MVTTQWQRRLQLKERSGVRLIGGRKIWSPISSGKQIFRHLAAGYGADERMLYRMFLELARLMAQDRSSMDYEQDTYY
jgi:hypothetical protein